MEIAFTERELDIMAVLWEKGPCTVAEVRDTIADDLAYTTVLTMLRVLQDKKFVAHTEEGRAHRYHALVKREDAGRSALRKLKRKVFGSSPEMLLTQLVTDQELSREELQRLRDLLDERLREEEE